jgi:RHS repeat-associated protein
VGREKPARLDHGKRGQPHQHRRLQVRRAGRRIERTISQGAAFQRTQYVYDGIQAIGELVDGRLEATILTGLNLDEVIARTVNVSGGQNPVATKSYLTDALGSVLALTRQDQAPEVFYSYSAYGETTQLGIDADDPANSNEYTARENDGLVGGTSGGSLYYYRARYMDPVLKRFISEDPIGLEGGMNVYSYVYNNPTFYADPSGLEPFKDRNGKRCRCSDISVFRQDISLKGDDGTDYGHHWVEMGSESYGFWPNGGVGIWGTFAGVPGSVNRGRPRDPHHGDRRNISEMFNPTPTVWPSNATCEEVCERAKQCVRNFAGSYAQKYGNQWSWRFDQGWAGDNSCHIFQSRMFDKCNLRQ